MMILPYFMTNKAWYNHDEKEDRLKLTPEGEKINKVKRSFEDYQKDMKKLEKMNAD